MTYSNCTFYVLKNTLQLQPPTLCNRNGRCAIVHFTLRVLKPCQISWLKNSCYWDQYWELRNKKYSHRNLRPSSLRQRQKDEASKAVFFPAIAFWNDHKCFCWAHGGRGEWLSHHRSRPQRGHKHRADTFIRGIIRILHFTVWPNHGFRWFRLWMWVEKTGSDHLGRGAGRFPLSNQRLIID